MVPLLPPLGDPNHKELISFIEINKTGDSGYSCHRTVSKTTPTCLNRKSIGHILCSRRERFVRHKTVILCNRLARARRRATQSPSPCEPWLPAKLCRCAVPSVFMSKTRATSDAFPTRHWLSRHPCRSLGAHAHRCIISTPYNSKTSNKL
jgi:hypothetical protein